MKYLKELVPYLIIVLVVILVRTFFVTPVRVNGQSMYPTLKGGEIMLLNKLGHIDRFDIVVLKPGYDNDNLIKRVIALPGETIEIKDKKILVNGKEIEDKFGYYEENKNLNIDYTVLHVMDEIKLGSDEYFVLGDNRYNSADSRVFGPIKEKDIKGTTNFVMYPFKQFGKVK